MNRKTTVIILSFLFLLGTAGGSNRHPAERWWKGNTHTHSLWSDGDAAPELVADWYRSHGYHFLALTDHDILSEGEKWCPISDSPGSELGPGRVVDLRERFGEGWIVERATDGGREMRLKTLAELRERFEAPGEFLFIQGEEISDSFGSKPLHFNALNLVAHIPTQGGDSVQETLRRNVAAVVEQADRLNRPIVVHINHPNWIWAITPEELAAERGTHLFELYNGSTGCNNLGDETHPSMEGVWDIALTLRLAELGLGLMYGLAVDDTHNYFSFGPDYSNPGRGWIVVRARRLTLEAVLDAVRTGDFYSSTGVDLKDFRHNRTRYVVEIDEEADVIYTTQFIGTRLVDGRPGEVGEVLHETAENPATYRFRGDELYVRARVISSRMQSNYAAGEEAPEYAWLQPVIPGRRRR